MQLSEALSTVMSSVRVIGTCVTDWREFAKYDMVVLQGLTPSKVAIFRSSKDPRGSSSQSTRG